MAKKAASRIYLGLIFAFLYMPIAVLILLSFNNSKSRASWGGFTLKWYKSLFTEETMLNALMTTLLVSTLSALIAALIGTLASIGIQAMKARKKAIYLGISNIPLLNADIVTGISMMLLLIRFTELGTSTIIISHITFCIPYVILNVLPRFNMISKHAFEAALDLGAPPFKAFFKVIWPDLLPGVLSGFFMAFTMSLDDFSITYFTKGPGINTLSTMIYTELKKGILPEMYALSTILFLIAFALLLIMNFKKGKDN